MIHKGYYKWLVFVYWFSYSFTDDTFAVRQSLVKQKQRRSIKVTSSLKPGHLLAHPLLHLDLHLDSSRHLWNRIKPKLFIEVWWFIKDINKWLLFVYWFSYSCTDDTFAVRQSLVKQKTTLIEKSDVITKARAPCHRTCSATLTSSLIRAAILKMK